MKFLEKSFLRFPLDNIIRLKPQQRKELFLETAAKMGVTPVIVEKDFWVCWVLDKIFQSEDLKNKLLFKGGTSLSKVYHVIERFSEDIDLILNWKLVTKEDPWKDRTKTKQSKLNKEINNQAKDYITQTLKPLLEDLCGLICTIVVDSDDPHCLNVIYPRAFSDQYIRPEVRLEIGPLASWLPYSTAQIKPYVAKYFPQVFSQSEVKVLAIEGKRTFWEKVTILHMETHRPEGKVQPVRYSRHYYDLARMALSDIKTQALADLSMLQKVAEFKMKFYPTGWASYETARPGSLKLIPSKTLQRSIAKDYRNMQDMIFGEKVSMEEIFKILGDLESEINDLKKFGTK